jgi:hypothetical protein
MSGGKEKTKTNQMLAEDRQQQKTDSNQFLGAVNQGISSSQGRANDMYNVQFGGFKDFAEGKYDYNPGAGGSGGGGGGGGVADDPRLAGVQAQYQDFMKSGGVDPTKFNEVQGQLTDLSKNGGWSDAQKASMQGNIDAYKQIGATGGVDDAGQARMRGGGIFEEFGKTGGLSDTDRANIRSRATSTIPAYYQQMQDESNRSRAVQGGYGPGAAALSGRMARQQAAAGADASRNAELGIMDQVNQGRQWGGTNMASSEAALQGLMSSNRLAGLGGATAAESGMVTDIANRRLGASNYGAGNETGMQGLIQQGKEWGTQGMDAMAQQAMARAAAGSAQSSADARWAADFNRDGRMQGLEGMQSLYGMKPGEVEMYMDKNLQGRGLNYGANQTGIDQRITNNPQTDWASTIGTIAGAAGGAMTGLGAIGVGANVAKKAAGR